MRLRQQLEEIRSLLIALVERQQVKDFYEVEEFARLVGKAPFTVREWCRLGRLPGVRKKNSGRGAFPSWVIPHTTLLYYQREGLLPFGRNGNGHG